MWHREGTYDGIAEYLFDNLNFDRLLLEYDTERSGGFGSSVALALKREARIPRISLNRSVIRMRASAIRLLRLRRIEFSEHR